MPSPPKQGLANHVCKVLALCLLNQYNGLGTMRTNHERVATPFSNHFPPNQDKTGIASLALLHLPTTTAKLCCSPVGVHLAGGSDWQGGAHISHREKVAACVNNSWGVAPSPLGASMDQQLLPAAASHSTVHTSLTSTHLRLVVADRSIRIAEIVGGGHNTALGSSYSR